MTADRKQNSTIILDKDDISTRLHVDLWHDFLETLNVDKDATEVCLQLSPLDHNKRTQ